MAEPEFDLFISYARKDNVPDESGVGWVTAIKNLIEEDSRRVEGREFSMFFDTQQINGMQDWQVRILGALRTSRLLLVCVSPNYFASEPCRWEWQEYRQRQARLLAGSGAGAADDGSVASVFFVELPGVGHAEVDTWREEVLRGNAVDLKEWFPHGAAMLARDEVRDRVRALGDDIVARLERAQRAETQVGNLAGFNPYFVGRMHELAELNQTLRSPASIGVVTVVHGLGGLGKTELVVQYAHAYQGLYPFGVWHLPAEGQTHLLPLMGMLADVPAFGFTPSDAASADPTLRGQEVLAELGRRLDTGAGGALLVLDNVSSPALLAEPQVALLPTRPDLHLAATSRLGETDFPTSRGVLGFLELGTLPVADGVTLIRDHQPRQGDAQPGFATAAAEQAAADIVELLGGFTLAVEQVSLYLGRTPEKTPQEFLTDLRAEGLTWTDEVIHDDDLRPDEQLDQHIRHQGKTLAVILGTTLADLTPSEASALRLAALLPAESVPWPWLLSLLGRLEPDAVATSRKKPEGSWPRIRRTLLGRRLLTRTGSHPDLARMHRLYAAHLAAQATDSEQSAVRDLLITRAKDINDGRGPTLNWEYGALLDGLLQLIPMHPHMARVLNSEWSRHAPNPFLEDNPPGWDAWYTGWPDLFMQRILDIVGDDRPSRLATLILSVIEADAATQPNEVVVARDLSRALAVAANASINVDPDQSIALSERALAMVQELIASGPHVDAENEPLFRFDLEHDLTDCLEVAARAIAHTNPKQALAFRQRVLTIRERRASSGSRNEVEALATAMLRVSRSMRDSDPAEALILAQRALEINEALAAADPDNLNLAYTVEVVSGDVIELLGVGTREQALALHRRTLTLAEDLAADNPDSRFNARELSMSLFYVANNLVDPRLGQHSDHDRDEALSLSQRALEVSEKLAANRPGDLDALKDLLAILILVARLVSRDDSGHALALLQRALTIAETRADALPHDQDAVGALSDALVRVARMVESSDPDHALALRQRVLTIAETRAETQPHDQGAERELYDALWVVSGMMGDADPAEALALSRRTLLIAENRAEALPHDLDAARVLSEELYINANLTEQVEGAAAAGPVWRRACLQFRVRRENGWLGADEQDTMDYACSRTEGGSRRDPGDF